MLFPQSQFIVLVRMVSNKQYFRMLLTAYKHEVGLTRNQQLLTATRKKRNVPNNRKIIGPETSSRFYKNSTECNKITERIYRYCSEIQEFGGNPRNLTRLNVFRVHLIYMIRFPPKNGLRKVFLSALSNKIEIK
jgi:hypothetical protein